MKTTLLAACSLLALTVPAATAAADNGVPHGHVLEFAKQTTISGSGGNDGSTFTKAFETQHRSHVTVTDNATGKLEVEYTTSPSITRRYVASENTLYLQDGTGTPYEQTPAEEGRYFQQGIDDGCFVKVGVTGNLDRYKMIDNPQIPCSDSPDTKVDVARRPALPLRHLTGDDERHVHPGRVARLHEGPHRARPPRR